MKFAPLFSLLAAVFLLSGFTSYDVQKICMENAHAVVWHDNANALGIPSALLETGTPQDIYQATMSEGNWWLGAWILQDPSHANVAQGAWFVQGGSAAKVIQTLLPGSNVRDIFANAVKAPAHYSPEALAQAADRMKIIMSYPTPPELEEIKEKALLLCAPYLDMGCPNALRDVIDVMAPRAVSFEHGGAFVSLPGVLQQLLTDPGFVQGASHFGLKILDRMNHRGRFLSATPHLLEELRDSFLATGSTAAQANARAWAMMAFYGTRGASLSALNDIPNKENLPVWLSEMVLSGALSTLDIPTLPGGLPYSYPEQIKSHCAYGRPYHFWLSAYLSRYLLTKGYKVKTAVIAPHLMSKLYEFGSTTVTRDTERPYRDKFFNFYNVMVQINMAYNDAGSLWGAEAAGRNAIVVDPGLETIFSAAKPMPDLTPEELEKGIHDPVTRYGWFNRVIAPDAWISAIFRLQK